MVKTLLCGMVGEQKILCDPSTCNLRVLQSLPGTVLQGDSPINVLKATKNEVEREGFRQCHIRDGAALVGGLYVAPCSLCDLH